MSFVPNDFREKTNAEHSSDSIPLWRRRCVFSILVYLQIMCNFDSGVLAAILGNDSFGQSELNEGWLASSVYLGHIIGCVCTGSILNHRLLQYRIKWVLSFAMIMNAGCIFIFAYFDMFVYMFVSRLVSGMMAAILVVYSPLWVDDYAPSSSATTWMAILQAAVPVGVMLGYVTSGVVLTETSFTWKYSFYLQCLCLMPPAFLILLFPRRNVNLQHVIVVVAAASTGDTTPPPPKQLTNNSVNSYMQHTDDGPSTLTQIKMVLRNRLYLATVFALSSLYFVVTGLQLWATAYLTAPEPIHAELSDVVAAFSIACITGPTVGVIMGGILMDVSGGYAGNMSGATTIGALCGTLAFASSIIALQMTTLWGFIIMVWLVLFGGGAVVPITTGLNIACVPKECRAVSCSVAAIMYNLFGYFLGPLACGMASHYNGGSSPLILGMKIVLGWSGMSWICILYAAFVVRTHSQAPAPEKGSEREHITGGESPADPSLSGTISDLKDLQQSLASLLQQKVSAHEVQLGMTSSFAAPVHSTRNLEDYVPADTEATAAESQEVVRQISRIRPVRVVTLSSVEATGRLHRSFQNSGSPGSECRARNNSISIDPRSRTATLTRGRARSEYVQARTPILDPLKPTTPQKPPTDGGTFW